MISSNVYISSLPLINTLSNYIDKSHDVSLSGNFEIYNANLSVTNGRMSGGKNSIAVGENSFAYGNNVSAINANSYAIGVKTYAGTNSYKIRYGDTSTNVWYLDNVSGLSTGLSYSIRIINNYDNTGTILSINPDDNSISTTQFPTFTNDDEKHGNIVSVEYLSNSDQNTLWIPGYPELGNLKIDECLTAIGYGTIAQKWCAKAEGVDTIAVGKYSHAEGNATSAFGWASHVEGIETFASGQRSHAEGLGTSAFGSYSHAEGLSSIAIGNASHAEGYGTSAFGSYSHAEGLSSIAIGNASNSIGYKAITNKPLLFVWNGNNSAPYDPTESINAGEGAFCINPKNGINGFYIGSQSLGSIIENSEDITEKLNKLNVIENNVVNIEDDIGISGYIDYAESVSSHWYRRISDTKVLSETTTAAYGEAYTQFKYVVDGGKKYHLKTGFVANNAAALFIYDETFNTPVENTVSCLDYSQLDDPNHPNKICEIDVVVPANYSKYILAFTNCKTILPNDQIEVIAYYSDIPLNLIVKQNTLSIIELSDNNKTEISTISSTLSIDYIDKIANSKNTAYNEALSDANDYTNIAKSEAIETAGTNATNYSNSVSSALSTDYVAKIAAAKSQAYNEALSDANIYTDDKSSTINESIKDIKLAIAMQDEVSCSLQVLSAWYTKLSNIKVNSQSGYTGYSLLKYVVEGGKKYHFNTFINASMAIGLFKYDENFNTPVSNSVSCIIAAPDLALAGFYEADLIVPNDDAKYILGISNKWSGIPISGLPDDKVKVICYESNERKINDVVEADVLRINEISNSIEIVSSKLSSLENDVEVVVNSLESPYINIDVEEIPSAFWSYNNATISYYTNQYSAISVKVDAGLKYKLHTFNVANAGTILFTVENGNNKLLSTIVNSQSDWEGKPEVNIDVLIPNELCGYTDFWLGVSNSKYYDVPKISLVKYSSKFDIIDEKLNEIKQLIYAPKKIKYSEATKRAWFTAPGGKMHYNYNDSSSFDGFSALKFVIEGGKTYKIKTWLAASGAVGIFSYTDDLSVPDENSLSVLRSKALADPAFMYEATVEIPTSFGKCILGVTTLNTILPVDDVEVVDIYYNAAEAIDEFNGLLEGISNDIAYISNEVKIDEDMLQYYNKSLFDYLCADTLSSWVYGTFDKGKLVFTVDDGRTDAGYIALFLSSEYGYPMCFAVPVASIKNPLITSYVEDNGDGTSSTYTCDYNYLSDLLIAEEAFGGETYAHDCSKGRWMLSVEGEGLVPKFTDRMAEYYFIEARSALQKLGLQVDGFVSPWHDNLDCYIATMSKYFKYARMSTRSYPNLPYLIPYKDVSSGTLAEWKGYIDQVVNNKTLLMAYTHGIGGSATFKMKDLKAIFDYVKEKVDTGLLDVTTVKTLRRQYIN